MSKVLSADASHPTFSFVGRSREVRGFNLPGTATDYELMLRFPVKHRISSIYILYIGEDAYWDEHTLMNRSRQPDGKRGVRMA
jgi:hypothetical protein